MKGINTPGKQWTQEALPLFPPQGTGYLTLLSRHSLQRGTFLLIPFLSLRWEMKKLKNIFYCKINNYIFVNKNTKPM
jgi:hypothetical protein